MKIWKWLGLNTKEARIEMNRENQSAGIEKTRNTNWHSTVQTIAICAVLAVGLYACAGPM